MAGLPQIFVVPYPGPGGTWQISASGGYFPEWSKSGPEIFYASKDTNGALYTVPYSVEGNSFVPGNASLMFQGGFLNRSPDPFCDVAPDGQHIAVLVPADGKAAMANPPSVVLNWSRRVERLAAASRKSPVSPWRHRDSRRIDQLQMILLPGRKLEPYQILGPIGAGGMGAVYRARNGRLSRDAALKILPAVVVDREELAPPPA